MIIENLVIDKIAVTLKIKSKKRRKKISKALKALMKQSSDELSVRYLEKYISKKIGTDGNIVGYYDTYLLNFVRFRGLDFTTYISINPSDSKNSFFRLETNPANAGRDGMDNLFKLFQQVLGKKHASRIYNEGVVTRVDLAVDVFDLKHDYYLHVTNRTYSRIIRNTEGRPTHIIGKRPCRFTCYDKDAEQALKNASVQVHPNWMRFEFQLGGHRCSIADLSKVIENPFQKLTIYKVSLLDDPYFDLDFILQVRKHGLNRAIHRLKDEATKRRYRYRLKRHKITKFNPDKFWKGWEQATDVLKPWQPQEL